MLGGNVSYNENDYLNFNKVEISSKEDITSNWIFLDDAKVDGNKNVAVY